MSARELLAQLRAAGVHVRRVGDDLKVRAAPGVPLAPHLDLIRANKPDLLRELLQERIAAALHVEPDDFDRESYEQMYTLWKIATARKEEAR